jgi:SNF2 family DNA or RNA helicase
MTSTVYDDVLYDYQRDAADRIALQKRILLADQPGLGKTLMVLGALEKLDMYRIGKNILIVTPIINAQTAWIDSIEKFIVPRWDVNVVDVSRGSKQNKIDAMDTLNGLCNIVVANHNAIDWVELEHRVPNVNRPIYDAIIIDESHMVLPITNPKKITNFWRGLRKIGMVQDPVLIAVSGTPDRGKLENRFGTWVFLDPWNMPDNRYKWFAENFHMYEQKVAYNRVVQMVGAVKNNDKWIAKDKAMMIRRTKSEVLSQLPPKQYIDIEIAPHPDQAKDYLKLRTQAMDESNKIEPMTFAIRARQISDCQWTDDWEPDLKGKSAKLEWLLEWLDSRGYVDNSLDGKVVIASQFSKVLHYLAKMLEKAGMNPQILDGSVPQNQRDQIQRDFQDGDCRIILLSGTMGVGITLDAADDLIMFDMPYDPDRVEQIEDRIHRASNMHHVTIWNLISVGMIDQPIMEKVTKRYKVTRKFLDGARGVEFERDILAKISPSKMSDAPSSIG